jgi:hypothetical protein
MQFNNFNFIYIKWARYSGVKGLTAQILNHIFHLHTYTVPALVRKSLEFYIQRKNILPIKANKSKAWKTTTSNNVEVMLHG